MMTRKLKVAAVQMDVKQTSVADRPDRATSLIYEAAAAGAQLVALPELFNTGYEYHERNYALAEPIDGQSATWMKAQSLEHNIHLVGSILLLDENDIYNTALLVAPDGRTWRHDKIHIVLWEQAYFREGNQITIADTDLGKLGLMICSDTLRPDLWAQYAGHVDAMILMFSPGGQEADLVFPDGFRMNLWDFERTVFPADDDVDTDDAYFATMRWMLVPMLSASQTGVLRTKLPKLEVLLQASEWAERTSQASHVYLEMVLPMATVISASGKEGMDWLAQGTTKGDGIVLAEIELADTLPQPQEPQPKMHVGPDHIAALVRPLYREGVARRWGTHQAPKLV